MPQFVSSRWFALVELGLVSICGAIWYLFPGTGGWLIGIALLPGLARLLTGHMPYRRTKLDVFFLFFLITAGVGVLAAYHREAAWAKFWILVGAVLIYYALASQPRENLSVIGAVVSALGVIIAACFLLTNDWKDLGGDLAIIDRLGLVLAKFHLSTDLRVLPPNFAGGILAVLLPVNFVVIWTCHKDKYSFRKLLSILGVMLVLAGLFMTSSRGAWLAALVGLTIWGLWRGSRYFARRTRIAVDKIFLAGIAMAFLIFTAWLIADTSRLLEFSDRLPGLPTGGSRIELAQSTFRLIEDYPFTGGGLHAFAGNYSRYIMLNPYFLFAYSHNFYLDVVFEQGLIGGGATLALFGISLGLLWRIVTQSDFRQGGLLFAEAYLAALIILLVHGLFDDALYGDSGTPLLFMVPGIAASLWQSGIDIQKAEQVVRPGSSEIMRNVRFYFGALFLLFLLSTTLLFGRSIRATWQANLGALRAAQWELRYFPAEDLNDLQDIVIPKKITQELEQTTRLDPTNRTAHHRLGLVYMGTRDFSSAQEELGIAYRLDPGHRGVRKAYGYALVWAGELEEALPLLMDIPEAEYELDAYQYWWRAQDRRDLAWQSHQMADLLHEINKENFQRNRTGQ